MATPSALAGRTNLAAAHGHEAADRQIAVRLPVGRERSPDGEHRLDTVSWQPVGEPDILNDHVFNGLAIACNKRTPSMDRG